MIIFTSLQFEDAAREMADEVTKPRPLGEEEVQDIQITLKSDANPMSVRDLRVCFNIDSHKKSNQNINIIIDLTFSCLINHLSIS